MAIKHSPGCNCCGGGDSCAITTVTNEANGTADGLENYYTLGTPTAQEKSDLASDKILADGMGVLTNTDVINSIDNWSWRVLLTSALPKPRITWVTPAKFRIIAQATYTGGALTDHIFGEVEILSSTTPTPYWFHDFPLRIAIGKSVGGVETIFDETYINDSEAPNTYGPIYGYPSSLDLYRGTIYDNFIITDYVEGENQAFIMSQAVIDSGFAVTGRTFKAGDIVKLINADNQGLAASWVVYREIDASTNPTFTTIGDGLINGDYVFPSAAGTVVNAADALDLITLGMNESIEVTDDTQITTTAGWTLRASFDPTAGTPFITFKVNNTDRLHYYGDGLTIKGADVTGTPTGYKAGVSCISQTGAAEPLAYGGGTHSKILSLDTPSCGLQRPVYPHCHCAGDVEKDIWVQMTASNDWTTDFPNITDSDGRNYTLHSLSNEKLYRWAFRKTSQVGVPSNTEGLCSFVWRRVARYLSVPVAYSGTVLKARYIDFEEWAMFYAYRNPFEPFDPTWPEHDSDRLILRRHGWIDAFRKEAWSLSSPLPSIAGLDPGTWVIPREWSGLFTPNTRVVDHDDDTVTDVDSFDCENFSVQSTWATVSNTILDPESLLNGQTVTWSQA